MEVLVCPLLGRGRRGSVDGAHRLVVIPADVRAQLVAHAEREAPNEACGLLLLRDGRAERYEPGTNKAASPYRFELELDNPELWFAEDDGFELAVFHSHLSAPARPSRTDVENIGLWERRPYVILSLRSGDLAAFEIEAGQIRELTLATS
ncbi:MAG: M67 family metallopeptidase [Actinobacteria bacterium]|nr:MAG: M67 family metallopeptidase [Actinomycetota bacterium]